MSNIWYAVILCIYYEWAHLVIFLHIVERPNPNSLPTFSQCTSRIGDLNSLPPDLELSALTKWLAIRMVV